MGKRCEMDLMSVETPPADGHIDSFALDTNEVKVGDFARMLNALGPQTQVEADDDGAPRFVRFRDGVHKGELIADLWHAEAGITYQDSYFRVAQGAEELPMRLVTWLGGSLFCRGRGARLPTEAEWEYAARGRTARRFPWGDASPKCGNVALKRSGEVEIDETEGCAGALEGPVAVGTSSQDVTPEGVHDLGGNVSEWTDSKIVLLKRAVSTPPSSDDGARVDVDDPMAVRGGSYNDSFLARATGRTKLLRGAVAEDAGFRCAITLNGSRHLASP
jgi:formylglycine-generating enzyme required for sulfatase activity